MNGVIIGLAVVGATSIAALSIWWHFSRSNSLLQKWAADSGYRIVSQEYRTFSKGPFFWTSNKGQTVYYVVVEDCLL
jgi:hypothetical protein